MDEYLGQISEEKKYKPKLYQYPEHGQPSAVFELDELDDESLLLVLCARAQPNSEEDMRLTD
jgi:hypothetical protein